MDFGYDDMADKFILGDGNRIPFENGFFDITISESTLDHELAKTVVAEIDRVTNKIVFFSLISSEVSGDARGTHGDIIVETVREKETVQSYYNWKRIQKVIEGTHFSIKWCHLTREEGIISPYRYGRYYLVLYKERT